MTRRNLISGAVALAAMRGLRAQRRGTIAVTGRYAIPAGPAVRLNFHRLGQSLPEGATITSVPDDSGNGNNLSIYTGQSAQTPMFTAKGINGRGGLWCGANPPNPASVQTSGNNFAATAAVTVATGSVSFPVPAGLPGIQPGNALSAYSLANPNTVTMIGTVTSYSGTTLTASITAHNGAGLYSDWQISIFLAFSTSTNTPGTGTKTFVIPPGMAIPNGSYVTAWGNVGAAVVNWLGGTATYNSSTGSLAITVTAYQNSTSVSSWTLDFGTPCQPMGALTTPAASGSIHTVGLAETPLTVLMCLELGSNGEPSNNDASVLQVGNLNFDLRGQNSSWPKNIYWYNSTSGHGSANYPGATSNPGYLSIRQYVGPCCIGIINGFGGVNTTTRFMLGRGRANQTSLNWATSGTGTTWTSPIIVGHTASGGNNYPAGCIIHEIVVYARALTDAELDLWQVYCNQMYGTSLCLFQGGSTPAIQYITERLLLVGDSNTDSQNATFGQAMPTLAKFYVNKPNVEIENYGVGSATMTAHTTNIAYYTGLYDSTLSKNVVVLFGWYNDYSAGRTYADVYNGTGGTPGTSIANFVATMQAAGFKVGVCTMTVNGQELAAATTWRNGLNGLIIANTVGADFIVNHTGTAYEAYIINTGNGIDGHYNNKGYDLQAQAIASQLAAQL